MLEGSATDEASSKLGKTDIYLNIAKGNILCCRSAGEFLTAITGHSLLFYVLHSFTDKG